VTRAVAALEEALGVKLLERTTRTMRTTEAGQRYLEDARQILAGVAAADEAAAGHAGEPRGHLAITAPVLFGRMFIMPVVVAYLEQHPQVTVETMFVDRVVNLIEEGLDVGVRIGELPDSTLRALNLGQVRNVVVAAPSYLKRAGIPKKPQDLKEHSLIASTAGSFGPTWRFATNAGDHVMRIDARLRVNTNDAAIAAACAGLGIVRVLSYQVAGEVAAGRLQILLGDFEPPAHPVNIVHRETRFGSPTARSFIDLIADSLRANPALA
jgi:DNA-binding transcriptional LysR family regulator